MHSAVFIPDGVGVRNFLLGDFMREIASAGETTAFHRIPESRLPGFQSQFDQSVRWRQCLEYSDLASTYFLRRALSHAHLVYCDTLSMRYARRLPLPAQFRRRVVTQVARGYGNLLATPSGICKLLERHDRALEKLPQVKKYREILSDLDATVLFCTHQRSLEVVPAVLAAKSLGIPTTTFIFSWDNLTSKGRFAARFDHYMVWSDLMREELLKYYPEVDPDKVHVVGTPQFDPYMDPSLLETRADFCKPLGLDPARPIICYSGGDAGTTPEDQWHVKALLDLVRAGKIKRDPQILVRPSPVDLTDRYDQIRTDYPELCFCMPEWEQVGSGSWSTVIATAQDVRFLANLTHHADINVNLASTMTLDFAIHDKPVVNVAFDIADPPHFGVPLRDYYYQFEHYRPVVDLGAARIAESPDSLAKHVNEYLDDPSRDREARHRFVELEVKLPLGKASSRIVSALERIASGG